jgi:membrane protease subunit HflK
MNWNTKSPSADDFRQIEDVLNKVFGNPKRLLLLSLIFAAVIGSFSSFYEVQPDERAVVTRFGRYVSTRGPGLNFKLPFGIDQAHIVSTRTEQEVFGFREAMTSPSSRLPGLQNTRFGASAFAPGNPAEESLMLTGDLNVAEVQWVVQYEVVDPKKWLFNVSNQKKNIRDISMATMRRVVGNRSVFDVLTVGREQLAQEARRTTQEVLDKYEMGISIRDFNLQRVTPPEPVQPSFNDVSAAIQNKNELVTNANAEYDRIIPEARGRAERAVLAAEGYKTQMVNRAKGDAERLVQLIEEYNKAPEITRTRLYLELVEELFERFDSVTIVDPKLKGVLPIFEGTKVSAGVLAAAKSDSESIQ